MARRIAIFAVTAVVLSFGLVTPASGTLEATDADDASAKSPFDVSRVRSGVSDHGIVVIHVHFYEKLIWNWPNSGVRIEIDSRAGGGMDYRLQVVPRRGNRNLRCLLGGPWGTAANMDVGVAKWPQGVTCWVKKSLLHPTRRPRWRVRATYNPPPCECTTIYDRAPNTKQEGWYPHF